MRFWPRPRCALDALVGADDQKRQDWMNTHNKALGGKPLQLVQDAGGLVATLNYLDGMRTIGAFAQAPG